MALAAPLSVSCQEFRQVSEIEFPKRDAGRSVIIKRPCPVRISTEIAPGTGAPVIAVTLRHDVWYLDGSNLEVIRWLSFSDDEFPAISKNGRYVSVFWEVPNELTGKRLKKVRVENDHGVRLWEMDFLMTAMAEPSPTGGFVAYPNTHLDDESLYDGLAILHRIFEPPWEHHGLLVFNSNGDLVLESLDSKESRARWYTEEVSKDGRYLALAFVWVPPENRETRATGGDKGCLVFYDIEKGVELWRHYFDGVRFPELEISPEAERIICFVSTSGDYMGAGDFHLCLFDFKGRLLLDKSIEGCRGWLNGPGELKLSPDGRFFAFTTRDSGLHVYRTAEGRVLWERTGDPDGLKPHDFGVNSDGSILAFVGSEERGVMVRKLVQTNGRGEMVAEFQVSSGFPRARARVGPVGDSGFYWVMAGRRLMLYKLQ